MVGRVRTESPDLVEALFTGHRHHTMATLRLDGSLRMSGTEVKVENGQFILGMMLGTRRAADLHRDPRVAIHCHSVDPPPENEDAWSGEAKLAGRAIQVPAEVAEAAGTKFHIDISEVVPTRLGDPADHLVIESWRLGEGHRSRRR